MHDIFGLEEWDLSSGIRGMMLYEAHYAITLVNLFTMATAYLMVFITVDRIQVNRMFLYISTVIAAITEYSCKSHLCHYGSKYNTSVGRPNMLLQKTATNI